MRESTSQLSAQRIHKAARPNGIEPPPRAEPQLWRRHAAPRFRLHSSWFSSKPHTMMLSPKPQWQRSRRPDNQTRQAAMHLCCGRVPSPHSPSSFPTIKVRGTHQQQQEANLSRDRIPQDYKTSSNPRPRSPCFRNTHPSYRVHHTRYPLDHTTALELTATCLPASKPAPSSTASAPTTSAQTKWYPWSMET